jgi:hypothetical protein
MKVGIPDSPGLARQLALEIDEVNLFVPVNHRDRTLKWDYLLGNSRNGRTWVLFAEEIKFTGDETDGVAPENLVAWLENPPKRSSETIGEILHAAHESLLAGVRLDDAAFQSIIDSYPFPTFKTVSEYIPVAPEEWGNLPAEIEVAIGLSDGAGVNRESYEEYGTDSIEKAVSQVKSPRVPGYLFHYRLIVKGVTPLCPYEVDWPLSRRGKQAPYKKEKIQSQVPWDMITSSRLVSIYQDARYVSSTCSLAYFDEPTVRLVVAGRSPENAISNWVSIAKYLRSIRMTEI